ncbi:FAD-dependent oxidoreductase [Streptomyces cuspidosporus]|uniref:FAD/NAD(P)-binding domain-containing protein n=1 Tax=Streptomyces cuspidosporus TaxID=66882 RepID=A0ABN3GTR6_9ACTN
MADAHKVTVVQGRGTFVGGASVDLEGTPYTGQSLVPATGSYVKSLPGPELGGRVITGEDALRLDHVPAKVVVRGGGFIGVEGRGPTGRARREHRTGIR